MFDDILDYNKKKEQELVKPQEDDTWDTGAGDSVWSVFDTPAKDKVWEN